MSTYKKLILTSFGIYAATIFSFVLCAWIFDQHSLDLTLTVSKYIGLKPWSSIVYVFVAVIFCAIIAIAIMRSDMSKFRKVLYLLMIPGVMGCAIFPCTPAQTLVGIHRYFSNSLVVVILLSLITTIITTASRRQKIISAVSLVYLAIFMVCYVLNVPFVYQTIFIGENLVFATLFLELIFEPDESPLRQQLFL